MENTVDARLEQSLNSVANYAKGRLALNFPNRPNLSPEKYWPYHHVGHSTTVDTHLTLLALVLVRYFPEYYAEKDMLLGKTAALSHDIEQRFMLRNVNGALKRVRPSGVSEIYASAHIMNVIHEQFGGVIGLTDAAKVSRAIMSTTVEYDPKFKTVVHPYLGPHSSINDVLLALADVNTAGIKPPDLVLVDSINLFKEDNVDFLQWWLTSDWPSITEPLRQRMIDWLQFQVHFITGRRDRLEIELGFLPGESGRELIESFGRFDECIAATHEWVKTAKDMSFEELRSYFDYS